MDVALDAGDQLIIEIDVVDGAGQPLDLTDFEVRYVIEGVWDASNDENPEDDGDGGVEVIDGDGTKDRVRLTIPVDFEPGRYEHECKVKDDTIGPATILRGVVLVEPSLIGSDMEPDA